ncbi:MAG: ABC transporter ATP-binding protein [Desulfobacteraceae bacterium]|nr:MAG: ABC transporter ATP-binding protein [Desulfobacteraceae bacterium]
MNATPCIIKLSHISFAYPGSDVDVLNNLDLTLCQGEKIGLIAPNGSGKTTLFHTIMGLSQPRQGTIELLGKPMRTPKDFEAIRTQIGLLFQDADDQLFCPTVLDDVAFGPLNLGFSKEEAKNTALETIHELGLSGIRDSVTHRLSGGQKRLVALAAVLAMRPKALLLDEPTAGLDMDVKETLINILNSLDISMMIISHEFDFIHEVTHKIYSMENGKILTDEEVHVHQHEHVHRHGRHPHKH